MAVERWLAPESSADPDLTDFEQKLREKPGAYEATAYEAYEATGPGQHPDSRW